MNTQQLDTAAAKQQIDMREFVARDLGVAPQRKGNYWKWCCPFHRESTPSFTVYDDHFYCFGCAAHGDHIAWLMQYRSLKFIDACRELNIPLGEARVREYTPRPLVSKDPPSKGWQEVAWVIIEEAQQNLLCETGERARFYLNGRGIINDTIREAQLGYLPGAYWDWKRIQGINMPCGLLIPWIADGEVWGLKVRRATGKPKYVQSSGGKISAGLYNADRLKPGQPVILTEGELDTLVLQQEAGDLVNAVTLGSATTGLDPRWLAHLAACTQVFTCYDPDAAGNAGADRLAAVSSRIVRLNVPIGKDVNDLHLSGKGAVREWVHSIIPTTPALNMPDDCPPPDQRPTKLLRYNMRGLNARWRCAVHTDQWFFIREDNDGWYCAICAGEV